MSPHYELYGGPRAHCRDCVKRDECDLDCTGWERDPDYVPPQRKKEDKHG